MQGEPDFIIVGAGSAGSVLAERLSADGRYRVLVIEAGGTDRRFYVQLPLGYGKLFYDPTVNWLYKTEPDPGLAGQRDHWPRGKLLGGSSSINAMVYIRGHRDDYEDWKALGNTGWGWDEVLPAYRAMEDNEAGGDAWRGTGGPLFISANRRDLHPLVKDYIASCEAAGLAFTPDFNGAEQEGTGTYQLTVKGGRRNSAARAFLRPAMKRPNVEVLTHAQVTRVIIEGGRALGVEVDRGGRREVIRARREVILSGGAINSPQILQLSGIGPGALLQEHGITVLRDNPNVGDHLNDHQGLNYTYRMTVPTLNDVLRPWWGKLKVGLEYLAVGARAAEPVDQPRRRVLPHPARPAAAEHAALFPGILDPHSPRWRAADPVARPVFRDVDRAVELSADQPGHGTDRKVGSPGASGDHRQRLFDEP